VLKEMTMKALLSPLIGRLLVLLRNVGPYAAIELLLPGGSIVALLYWWYRHRASARVISRMQCAVSTARDASTEAILVPESAAADS